MKNSTLIPAFLICTYACSTASELAISDVDASSSTDASVEGGNTDGGISDGSVEEKDSQVTEDSGLACPPGEFGAVDYSWQFTTYGVGGAIAASERGVGTASFSECTASEATFQGFDEYFPIESIKNPTHVCYGSRSTSRAATYVWPSESDSGLGFYVVVSTSPSRDFALEQVGYDPQIEGGLEWGGTGIAFPAAGSYYANAMATNGATVRIAAEGSKLPPHAAAISYYPKTSIAVDYDDAAMKTYLGVAAAADATYYAGETVGGNLGVRKLTSAGTPDSSFGNGGLADLGYAGAAGAIAVDSLGRALVAWTSPANGIFVTRLTPTGSIDTSFGGGKIELPMTTAFEERIGMVQEPTGSVVIGGLQSADAGNLTPLALTRVGTDASVTTVRIALNQANPSSAANRVTLSRDPKCGYIYAATLHGFSTLVRAHW